jgi:hypothetical protein
MAFCCRESGLVIVAVAEQGFGLTEVNLIVVVYPACFGESMIDLLIRLMWKA